MSRTVHDHSHWGPADQLGAGNYLTPEKRLEATVNFPVHRASTIVSPDLDAYLSRHDQGRRYTQVTYGATGSQNARALADAITELEGGAGTVVTSP